MSKTINIETLYSILSTSKCIPQNGLDKVDKDLLFLFTEEPHNLQSLIDNRQDLSKGIILPSYINNNNYKKNYNNYNSQNTYSNNYSSNRDNREKDFTRGKNSQISDVNISSIVAPSSFSNLSIEEQSQFVFEKPKKNTIKPIEKIEEIEKKEQIFFKDPKIKERFEKDDMNIQELSNFCLLLGIGNFTPFLYLISKNDNKEIKKLFGSSEIYGPFNFLELKGFYNKKIINSTTDVKLIEIFKFKNGNITFPFDRFNNPEEIIMSIEMDNSLLNIASKVKDIQSNFTKKKEDTKVFEILKNPNEESSSKISENDNTIIIKNRKLNKEIEVVVKPDLGVQKTVIKSKKKKPQDLDTKTGFFQMTKEEKDYTQVYTIS